MEPELIAMRNLFRENAGEVLVGLLVVLVAAWFVLSSWSRTGGGQKAGAISVVALFPNASGVNVGTDVRVSGLKIGTVTAQALDPQSYQVAVTLALDPGTRIPSDSTAIVSSEGLLGGTFIGLTPGGSDVPLKTGDRITDTQGATDLMGLIGQFINRPSGEGAGGAAPGGGTGSAPTP